MDGLKFKKSSLKNKKIISHTEYTWKYIITKIVHVARCTQVIKEIITIFSAILVLKKPLCHNSASVEDLTKLSKLI